MDSCNNAISIGRKTASRRIKTAQILDAAEQLFERKGFQQATMEELAHAAGVSVGSLYNVFKGKEDVYAQIAERVGKAVLERFAPLRNATPPEQVIHDIIRLRLHYYGRDRLFFQPFQFSPYLGIGPTREQLGPQVQNLYDQYLQLVEQTFETFRKTTCAPLSIEPLQMTICMEGLILACMGHWQEPPQTHDITEAARQICNILLRGFAGEKSSNIQKQHDATPPSYRTTYVTRFDLERLQELITVVRSLGTPENRTIVDTLDKELSQARITLPREVPPDVVTMNSRVRLRNMDTGDSQVLALVFPKDMNTRQENVSILTPLGLGIFGRRTGDIFVLHEEDNPLTTYELENILYQPEANGDYHL